MYTENVLPFTKNPLLSPHTVHSSHSTSKKPINMTKNKTFLEIHIHRTYVSTSIVIFFLSTIIVNDFVQRFLGAKFG